MIETELKITLDAATAAKLSRNPVLAELRAEPRRSETLVSIYCDTADHALAAAGIALRLRKSGRKWVQTIKRGRMGGSAGLFSTEEIERPAPGGRLVLDGPDPEGALAAIAEATGETPIAPVFETRVRRMTERLQLPGGGLIEFALDRGEIVAGTVHAPILEAEIELVEGPVSAVFDLARRLFRTGPLAFSTRNKAARGYALVREGLADTPLAPRKAGELAYPADATLETVARDVLRDCFAQIADNMVVVAVEAIEGPHQLRVGLRRLAARFAVFRPTLGRDALAAVSDAGARIGRSSAACATSTCWPTRWWPAPWRSGSTPRRATALAGRSPRRAAVRPRCARPWRPRDRALRLRPRRGDRGAPLARAGRLFPVRPPRRADRRRGEGDPRQAPPQGDEDGPAHRAARPRRPARAAQGAEEAALRRRHAGADLSRQRPTAASSPR
jgi:hypothetical protein